MEKHYNSYQFWSKWTIFDYVINISKIVIIGFVAIVLFAQFHVWYTDSTCKVKEYWEEKRKLT